MSLKDALGFEPTNIYVSGPMRGYDAFNFPAFFEMAATLQAEFPKATIFNPAASDVEEFSLDGMDPLEAGRWLQEHGTFGNAELRNALQRDTEFITERCDLVVLLPGWEASSGAQAEVALARAIGIPVMVPADSRSEGLADPRTPDHSRVTPSGAPRPVSARPGPRSGEEVRVKSATGGEKGSKLAAFDQVSPEVERLVAEHFGKGARKYAAHNFRNGYPWSLSYSALRRHLADFWSGKEYDVCPEDGTGCLRPEGWESEPGTCFNHTGSLHIVAVIWHAMVLTEFYLHQKEYDDRYVYEDH